jgi:hypothetical protein
LAAATEPVRETLGYGQVNLLLFLLVAADLVALRRRYRVGVGRAPQPTGRLARCGPTAPGPA